MQPCELVDMSRIAVSVPKFKNQFEQIWNESFRKYDNVIDIPLHWYILDSTQPNRIIKAAELLTFNIINILKVVHNVEVLHIETFFAVDRYGILFLIKTNKLIIKKEDSGINSHNDRDRSNMKSRVSDAKEDQVDIAEQKKFTNKLIGDADYKELRLKLNIKDEVKDVRNEDTDLAFKNLRPNTHQNIDE